MLMRPFFDLQFGDRIVTLLAALVLVLQIAMVAQRWIVAHIRIFAAQSFFLAMIAATIAWYNHAPHIYIAAALTLVVKVIMVPILAQRHSQNATSAGCGRGGGENDHQADFSTCTFYLSLAFRGDSWPRDDFHYGVVQSFQSMREGGIAMDSATIIRVVAGVLVVVILIVLIQRRRTRTK